MPSRRHNSAMLSSPRSPSSTTRIFSSAEKCRRVARRMSLIASSAGCFSGPDFCLIFAPCGYDDPEILPTRKQPAVSKALTADTHVGGERAVAQLHPKPGSLFHHQPFGAVFLEHQADSMDDSLIRVLFAVFDDL